MGKGRISYSNTDSIPEQKRFKSVAEIKKQEAIFEHDFEEANQLLIDSFIPAFKRESLHYTAGLFVPLSGGADSGTVLTFAVRYADHAKWKRKQIVAAFCTRIHMYHGEEEDYSHAQQLARHLGVTFQTLDITPILLELDAVIDTTHDALLNDERIARARALALSTLEDKLCLPSLCTGNYSEQLLGQFTRGCYEGVIDVIGDLFKTEVLHWGKQIGVPDTILHREKVSSELRNGSFFKDYKRIDPILLGYLLGHNSPEIADTLSEDVSFVRSIFDRVTSHQYRSFGAARGQPSYHTFLPRLFQATPHDSIAKALYENRCRQWQSFRNR